MHCISYKKIKHFSLPHLKELVKKWPAIEFTAVALAAGRFAIIPLREGKGGQGSN